MSTTITVERMTCGHCEQTVEEALGGKRRDRRDCRSRGHTGERRDPDTTALVQAVEDAGYTAYA